MQTMLQHGNIAGVRGPSLLFTCDVFGRLHGARHPPSRPDVPVAEETLLYCTNPHYLKRGNLKILLKPALISSHLTYPLKIFDKELV